MGSDLLTFQDHDNINKTRCSNLIITGRGVYLSKGNQRADFVNLQNQILLPRSRSCLGPHISCFMAVIGCICDEIT